MKEELEQFFDKHNLDYQTATPNEFVLKICPFCGDSRFKFYVSSEKGLYDCKICAHQGNIYQLKAKFGDSDVISSTQKILNKQYKPLDDDVLLAYENALQLNKNALQYLVLRGFTNNTIKHFRLGLKDADWITIPHFQDTKLWNIKQRNYIKKEFRRVTGQPTIIFNIDNVCKDKALLIVESETDCIAAWQMGLTNVVGLTGGAQGFKSDWMPFFNKFKKIYICLNSDPVGQQGAEKVANKIGLPKCKNVILPTNDVNDYLVSKEYTDASFKKYIIENATKYTVKDITSVEEYLTKIDDWYDDEGSVQGLELTEFPKLHTLLNGFKAEDLIILTGDSGVGKTTLSLNFMSQFLQNDYKCLFFSLEGKIMYYILRMMSAKVNIKYENLRDDIESWEILKDEFSEYPLYFYSGSQAELTPQKLMELLPAAIQLYDIDFIVIDNLQKFVRGVQNYFQRVSEAVSLLKDLAVDLKVPILLLSHITKRKGSSTDPITMHDVKDSSTIYQDADVFLIIAHDKEGNYFISVEKNRMGEGGIKIPYSFKKETGKFYETEAVPASDASSNEIIDEIDEESY